MGFFKRKTNAPLSTAMYQGDNATPERSPPRLSGGRVPLNTDRVQAANTRNKKNKKIPKGFFKRKNNEKSYVTVTPDNKEDGSSIEAGYPPQTRSQRETNTVSTTTPSKSLPAVSSSIQVTPPSSRSRDNKNNYQDDDDDETDDNIPALVSPGKYEDLPPSPHEEIKRNLNSVFYQNDNDDEGGVDTCRRGVVDNAMTMGDNNNDISNDDDGDGDVIAAGENKKFLQRFRSSWKKSPGKIRQKQDLIRLIRETNDRIESVNVGTDQSTPQAAVPETIDHSDDGSIPSLITEPEDVKNMNMGSTDRTTAVESTVHEEEPVSAPRTPTSLSRAPGPSRRVVAPFDEKLESGPTPRRALTLGERFLSLLQCGEDTTSDGYFGRIKCLDLCAQNNGDENELGTRRMDEEDQFVVSFIDELSKRGIKLIYHQAPADSSSDWTQLTVKLFLRPGQCHEREIRPPSLSWATLPVASRKVLTGSYDNLNESGEDALWTHLSLWDIYTVMGAEDDGTVADEECALNSPARTKATMSTTQSGFDSRDTYTRETTSYTRETTSYTRDTFDEEERTVPSSGFFSITAGSNGNVYVFEASSGNRRDYVVAGLKKMIGWATRHLIMGRLDVCAELYGEDAAPMSGELPSLVTPSQALSRVTHAFLDEL